MRMLQESQTFFVLILALLLFVGLLPLRRLHSLSRCLRSKSAELPFSPSRLRWSDIVIIILFIIWKHVSAILVRRRSWEDGKTLPELYLHSSLIIGANDVVKLNKAVTMNVVQNQLQLDNEPRSQNLMLLPALTTPMMLILLANLSNPVLPFGSVNTKNRFEFLDPQAYHDILLYKKTFVTARTGGTSLMPRNVKRGIEVDVVIEVEVIIEHNRLPQKIFRQIITVLQFLPPQKGTPKIEQPINLQTEAMAKGKAVGKFKLSSSFPFQWAAICGDYNPIHMSSIAAKAFGFRSKIAHGNHVVALVMEHLQKTTSQESATFNNLFNSHGSLKIPSFLEVEFKRPIPLPITLEVRKQDSRSPTEVEFQVVQDEKIHVIGRVGALQAF